MVAVGAVLVGLSLLLVGVAPVAGQLGKAGEPAPEIASGAWINSEPLTLKKLRGNVVLVEFWTYG